MCYYTIIISRSESCFILDKGITRLKLCYKCVERISQILNYPQSQYNLNPQMLVTEIHLVSQPFGSFFDLSPLYVQHTACVTPSRAKLQTVEYIFLNKFRTKCSHLQRLYLLPGLISIYHASLPHWVKIIKPFCKSKWEQRARESWIIIHLCLLFMMQ